jgi:hypothetical protein
MTNLDHLLILVHFEKKTKSRVNLNTFTLQYNKQAKGTASYLINPSKSSMVREHSLHKPSVITSSGVSVPRIAMTTVLKLCKTTTK